MLLNSKEHRMKNNERSYQDRPLAAVTGASTGIGYELAMQFAQNGYDLVVVSGSDAIFEVEDDFRFFGGEVTCVEADLATFEGVEKFYRAIKAEGRPLEAIALNAGVTLGGDFTTTSLKKEINLINLNVISVVHLTKKILKDMYKAGKGKILYTSSLTAYLPGPYEAVYNASKAFISSFAEGIRAEAKDHGITVTILMPGATNTNIFHRGGMDDTRMGSKSKYDNDPADVARDGFEALMAGREKVVAHSFKTKMQGFAVRWLPDRLKAEITKKMSEPGSAH